jgi:gliding motility-associated-like protein
VIRIINDKSKKINIRTLVLNIFLLFIVSIKAFSLGTTPFITIWKTDNPGTSGNNQIIIPTNTSLGGYNYTVDWGDGSISQETGNAQHTYIIPGTYTVKITGDFPAIYFNNQGDKEKILSIEQWGNNPWVSMLAAFYGCVNLQGNFKDNPDLSNVFTATEMFRNAGNFNSDISSWNVSNIFFMISMFNGASAFNQPIGIWDVSNVRDMSFMFKNATSFNQPIENWDVRQVTNMYAMFEGATNFNQPIGIWNVENVIEMNFMFNEATAFNQVISGWNVSNVTEMIQMFRFASAFNQDLGNWNIGSLTDATDMFLGIALSTTNYDSLLIGWNNQNVNPNVNFHGGLSQYCLGDEARDAMVSNDGWTISDGGSLGSNFQAIENQTATNFFVLPNIFGTNLSGNEAYFTGPNGTGTAYKSGDIINYNDFPSYPITLYIYDVSIVGCNSEQSFQLTIYTLPSCTNLFSPLTGTIDVSISTDLTWNSVANAIGYKLYIGTESGGMDILNALDVGNVLTYDVSTDLPDNTEIFVTIIPYNLGGDAMGCSEESFITENLILPPLCTSLDNPVTGDTNVSISTSLTWRASSNATGYRLFFGTNSEATNILNNVDVGDVLIYNFDSDLQDNTTFFIKIIPYNEDGNAIGCIEEYFTTEIIPPPCTSLKSPENGDANVSVSSNLSWFPVNQAIGYILSIGTTSSENDILNNVDIGNVLTYNLNSNLPESTEIFVNITPYDDYGKAIGCLEQSFTTEILSTVPPRFFTPNNDGQNDRWIVPNSVNKISRVYIFDRYGKLLKELIDIPSGWDGTYNSQLLPNGDYWFKIVYFDGKIIKGHFSLIR